MKAEKTDLVGEENGGWSIAKRLLQFNDLMGDGNFIPRSDSLPEIFKKYVIDNEGQREQVLDIEMKRAAYKLTQIRAAEEQCAGAGTFATSTFKHLSTQLESEVWTLLYL